MTSSASPQRPRPEARSRELPSWGRSPVEQTQMDRWPGGGCRGRWTGLGGARDPQRSSLGEEHAGPEGLAVRRRGVGDGLTGHTRASGDRCGHQVGHRAGRCLRGLHRVWNPELGPLAPRWGDRGRAGLGPKDRPVAASRCASQIGAQPRPGDGRQAPGALSDGLCLLTELPLQLLRRRAHRLRDKEHPGHPRHERQRRRGRDHGREQAGRPVLHQ